MMSRGIVLSAVVLAVAARGVRAELAAAAVADAGTFTNPVIAVD